MAGRAILAPDRRSLGLLIVARLASKIASMIRLALLPYCREKSGPPPGASPVAESVSRRTIALPFFTRLTDREVDLVCQTLELMITRITFARS